MRYPFCLCLVACSPLALHAADEQAAGPWTHEATISLSWNSVQSSNAENSPDTTIGGTTDTISWRTGFEGSLNYESPHHTWVQRLDLAYGRDGEEEDGDLDWVEGVDEIIYDSQYDWLFEHPHSYYVAWGLESVFTGPEPDEDPFDPTLTRLSTGYAQHYKDMLPQSDELSWRVGARVQRRFGGSLSSEERDYETGVEGRIRYQRKQSEDLDYHAQYDVFMDLEDVGNISHLFQAGLNFRINSLISLAAKLRAYYESAPDEAPDAPGYDELSWRQETLLSLIYRF